MLKHTPSILVGLLACAAIGAEHKRPNIIFMMTDNHGAWTLGCYGNTDIRTPHIDQLAADGALFERAYASNAVCSPTRATYLTGLIPSQHGVHRFLARNEAQMGPNPYCTIGEFVTLPRVLKDAGYKTGLVGKWHLGANMEPQEGFEYWITMPHGGTTTFYDAEVIENGQLRREPKYLTDLWTEHAIKFLRQNKDNEKPFFLFLAYNGPYALSRLLLRPARNRHFETYEAMTEFPSFPRTEMHPWQRANKDYFNNIVSIRRVAAEVSGVDDSVGAVLGEVERLGLTDDTLVVFCADQGWSGGHHGLWGMGDHTVPLTGFEKQMHIPLIWKHPGHIPAGRRLDMLTSNYDFMPTLLNYLGLGDRMAGNATQPVSPGRDYSPALRGEPMPSWDDAAFYEMENVRAIRTDRWAFIHRHPEGPHELYNMKADPHQQVNLFNQDRTMVAQKILQKRLTEFFDRYADPKYNLYKGGGSKTALMIDRNNHIWPIDEDIEE
ncbi:MAG: sulfatase family protein [Planctomycetota bacterium]